MGLNNFLRIDKLKFDAVKNLSQWLLTFRRTKSGFEENSIEYLPTIAVIINLLERGAPTR
jgi:hypothetical protein